MDAATNRDLESDVKRSNFREDLYGRLNVVAIVLPTRRERREDIPLQAAHYLKKFNQICNPSVWMDDEGLAAFIQYSWRKSASSGYCRKTTLSRTASR